MNELDPKEVKQLKFTLSKFLLIQQTDVQAELMGLKIKKSRRTDPQEGFDSPSRNSKGKKPSSACSEFF